MCIKLTHTTQVVSYICPLIALYLFFLFLSETHFQKQKNRTISVHDLQLGEDQISYDFLHYIYYIFNKLFITTSPFWPWFLLKNYVVWFLTLALVLFLFICVYKYLILIGRFKFNGWILNTVCFIFFYIVLSRNKC